MKKLIQTRLHRGQLPEERGNCLPCVIACFMDLESAEDVFQVQEHYHEESYWTDLHDWLSKRGWEYGTLNGHLFDGRFYLVSGVSPRNPQINHICIYQNGKLWHDPHPDGTGIVTEEWFEYLELKA